MIYKNHYSRLQEKRKWHRWFAWRPVVLGTFMYPSEYSVWLQWIERRLLKSCDEYEYRLKE